MVIQSSFVVVRLIIHMLHIIYRPDVANTIVFFFFVKAN